MSLFLRKVVDALLVVCAVSVCSYYAGIVLWPRLARSSADQVPNPCRRIAAVYIGMRLYQLEDEYSESPVVFNSPLEKLADYLRYDPLNPVPKDIIPDLADYDLDMTFLDHPPEFDATTIVIAAKAADKKTGARLVVLADGSMKAIRTAGRLVGRRLSDINALIYEVTPEKGIVVPAPAATE